MLPRLPGFQRLRCRYPSAESAEWRDCIGSGHVDLDAELLAVLINKTITVGVFPTGFLKELDSFLFIEVVGFLIENRNRCLYSRSES
jgi:hypothetical protein